MIKNIFKNSKGYTLVFAVIISSIILTIAVSILTISRKEFMLASSARESMYAFYAADSGVECAILNQNALPFGAAVKCANQNINIKVSGGKTYFEIKIPDPTNVTSNGDPDEINNITNDPCVYVEINKDIAPDANGVTVTKYTIESRGYNKGWDEDTSSCNVSSPDRVERSLKYITYY